MAAAFNPGALLGSSFALDDGTRVRLRLARGSDVALIRALLARDGAHPEEEPELARLLHFDPRRSLVICAAALIDSTETLVGIGAVDLDDGAEPEIVIVDARHADELTGLLTAALVGLAAPGRAKAA